MFTSQQTGLYHTVTLNGEEWRIPKKYTLEEVIGTGSYGVVASCINNETGQLLAMKKYVNIFPKYLSVVDSIEQNVKEDEQNMYVPQCRACVTQLRVIRELQILKHLETHASILTLHDLIVPDSYETFTDVYAVTSFMENNLRDAYSNGLVLDNLYIRYMIYQLLLALQYIHNAGIIHGNITPENILIASNNHLRLSDFKLARGCSGELTSNNFTSYSNAVQLQPYQAPELLLNCDRVGKSIDLWSVGCIMAYMLNQGKELFSGSSIQEQLCQIINVIETPNEDLLDGSKSGVEFIKRLEYVEPNEEWYMQQFQGTSADPIALDLLGKLLQFGPKKRISVDEALQHEYFQSSLCQSVKCDKIGKISFDFEKSLMVPDKEALLLYGSRAKKMCYNMILGFHGLTDDIKHDTEYQLDSMITHCQKNVGDIFVHNIDEGDSVLVHVIQQSIDEAKIDDQMREMKEYYSKKVYQIPEDSVQDQDYEFVISDDEDDEIPNKTNSWEDMTYGVKKSNVIKPNDIIYYVGGNDERFIFGEGKME